MATSTASPVVGKVIQVAGPAVDIQFEEGQIPAINTAIKANFHTPAALVLSQSHVSFDTLNLVCD